MKGARAFGKAIWDALGEQVAPRLVFEHPGEATLPTSLFVCATGGMVVICAGTTGYDVTMDLRYQWMRQKRFQGSHLSNDEEAAAATRLVAEGRMQPCLSKTYGFDDIPECHQLMLDNKHPVRKYGGARERNLRGHGGVDRTAQGSRARVIDDEFAGVTQGPCCRRSPRCEGEGS